MSLSFLFFFIGKRLVPVNGHFHHLMTPSIQWAGAYLNLKKKMLTGNEILLAEHAEVARRGPTPTS
jgi:hypothetical protein